MSTRTASHPSAPARAGIWGLTLTIAIIAVVMAASTASSPFYPQLQEDLGLTPLTVTIIFAVYPLGLLITLLFAGSISSHLGRKPVIMVGLVLLAASLAAFGWGQSADVLIGARVLQGCATALVISTVSTLMTELAPPALRSYVPLANSAAPMLGLAAGALLAGILMDTTAAPLPVTFGAVTAVALLLAVLTFSVPETAPRWRGVLRSLRPRVHVPAAVRPALPRSAFAIIASWGTGGLFISLGAHIARDVFGLSAHVAQGGMVGLLAGAATIGVLALWRRTATLLMIVGASALAGGTLLGLGAIASHGAALYLVAVAITGVGFGCSYAGALRVLLPLAKEEERAGLFSVIYLIAYLAFSVPAVIAGFFVQELGLVPTVLTYGAVVALLALLALLGEIRKTGEGLIAASRRAGCPSRTSAGSAR